jgi:hypothetical protein
VNHNRCHFAAQRRFRSETSTLKRVRFPAAPPLFPLVRALFPNTFGERATRGQRSLSRLYEATKLPS